MAAASEVKVKKEEEEEEEIDSKGGHSHQFRVKFNKEDVENTINCERPCTVLEALKSHLNRDFVEKIEDRTNYSDEKIIIQLSVKGKKSIVATHFPCSCIENDECLIVSCTKTKKVKPTRGKRSSILPRDKYSVFYISKEGGEKAQRTLLFRNKFVKQFSYLCVYAEKGTTVKEALERDGRFVEFEEFKLSDYTNSNQRTQCKEKVDSLHQKTFRICLPKIARANSAKEQATREQQGQQEQPSTSKQSKKKPDTEEVLDKVQKFDIQAVVVLAQQTGISLKRAMEETGSSLEEIYNILREQFPNLKALMESGFPGDPDPKELKLTEENFGKIQSSFSKVHRIRKLLKLGESVCKIIIKDVCVGTGFVLFDQFILTNAHLFETCVEGNKLQDDTDVYALFNYEEPEPDTDYYIFTAEKSFIDIDFKLDYAILELNPQGKKQNQAGGTEEAKIPAGLLSRFGPLPENGEACLIGHPAGAVKKMDPTCIIELQKREQAVEDQYKKLAEIFIIKTLPEKIKPRGIEKILMGGKKADKVGTYNTFMYHGASGSPVFDARRRVFGLHSAGFTYGFPKKSESVIEYAYSLLSIFESFVRNLKKNGKEELLERVQKAGKGNKDLQRIIESVVKPRQREQLEEVEE